MRVLSKVVERTIVLIDADLNNNAIERELAKEGLTASREYVRQIRNEHRPSKQSSHKHERCSIISEEKLALIIKDLDSGMTHNELGKKYGISGAMMCSFLKRHNLKKLPGEGKRTEAGKARRLIDDDKFLELYKATRGNIREIARQTGVFHLTAFNAAKRLGLKGKGKRNYKMLPRKIAIANHLYHSQGWPIGRIAKHLHMNWPTVKKYV